MAVPPPPLKPAEPPASPSAAGGESSSPTVAIRVSASSEITSPSVPPPLPKSPPANEPEMKNAAVEKSSGDHQAADAAKSAEDEPEPTWLVMLDYVPSWLLSSVLHMSLLLALALTTTGLTRGGKDDTREVFASTAGGGDPSDQLEDLPKGNLLEASPLEVPTVDDLAPPTVNQLAANVLVPATETPVLGAGIQDLGGALIGNNAGLAGDGSGIGVGDGPGSGDLSSLSNRLNPTLRRKMVREEGGTPGSERAVERALAWLAEHQKSDGSWTFDHAHAPKCRSRCKNTGTLTAAKTAATALALLPFLGTGQTHKHEGQYKKNIEMGLYFLVRQVKYQGPIGSLHDPAGQMYGHGLAAIVLCEAYGMTHDKVLERPAQGSLNFIVSAQDPDGGGWRYVPQQAGDTSVVGWQLMALKSGHMAYLQVPPETVRRATYFLDSVQSEEGAVYGYMGPASADVSRATSAIGLLCRMYTGWKKDHPAIVQGVENLSEFGPSIGQKGQRRTDMYYNYYATQVMHHYGGPQWTEWNETLREFLIQSQATEGHELGSWFFKPGDLGSDPGGRLYCTAMAAMILEVYYRHLPLYREQTTRENFFGR